MKMSEWAKKEVEIACKKENPNCDGKSLDYDVWVRAEYIEGVYTACEKEVLKC